MKKEIEEIWDKCAKEAMEMRNKYREIIDYAFGIYRGEDIKHIKASILRRGIHILEACKNDDGTFPDDQEIMRKRILFVVQACVYVYRDGYDDGYHKGYGEGLTENDTCKEEEE